MIHPHEEEIFHIRNASGQVIHCVHNFRDRKAPLVVLAPPFEGSVRSGLLPALYLLNNGFSTLRFDFTEHPGNSDGNVRNWTVSSALEDLEAVLRVARGPRFEQAQSISVFSISISSRVVYRLLAERPDAADLFVSLFGVVDLGKTVIAANREVDCNVYRRLEDPSLRYGDVRILRYEADADTFLEDLIDNDFYSLAGTKRDVERMRTPTILIMSRGDEWVRFEDCEAVFGHRRDLVADACELPNAGHELYKNPEAAREAFRGSLDALRRYNEMPTDTLVEPDMAEFIELNTRERAREAKYEDLTLRVVEGD